MCIGLRTMDFLLWTSYYGLRAVGIGVAYYELCILYSHAYGHGWRVSTSCICISTVDFMYSIIHYRVAVDGADIYGHVHYNTCTMDF
jgi:hypothetical protein